MNMVALVNGQQTAAQPQADAVHFLAHRREVVTRHTVVELRKARERTSRGLAVALANIDIHRHHQGAPSPPIAKTRLVFAHRKFVLVREDAPVPPSTTVWAASGAFCPEHLPNKRTTACSRTARNKLSDERAQGSAKIIRLADGLEQDKINSAKESWRTSSALDSRQARRVTVIITDRRPSSTNAWAPRRAAPFGDRTMPPTSNGRPDHAAWDMVVTLSHRLHEVAADCRVPRAKNAAGGREAGRNLGKTGSTSCSSPTRTITCCASPTAAVLAESLGSAAGSRNSRGKPIVNISRWLITRRSPSSCRCRAKNRTFPEDHYVFVPALAPSRRRARLWQSARPAIAVDLDEGRLPDWHAHRWRTLM
jgi:DNA gyrase subunit A